MQIYEITGFQTGVSKEGVNFLQPSDSFQNIEDGYIYRQVLQSRKGLGYFAPRLEDESRLMGVFENTKPDGTKDLLAVDKNFLYKYNLSTGVFDKQPFGGSLAAAGYTGFNLLSDDDYVSGTSYFTATNTQRFVFSGKGMDHVFFWDGTNVLDFTDGGVGNDNPDYAAPAIGTYTGITNAQYVFWYNNRLNLILPTLSPGSGKFSQGILYSGFRDVAGNGDKFNVPGSGLLEIDTYQNITGAQLLSSFMVINVDRSNWTIGKTTDAFNPYSVRLVPGVIGTDAIFSSVAWSDMVKSIGKTGLITTDGRQSLRFDNKIPYFTHNEIDQNLFNLTYGGFDRINGQFLWSYKNAASSLTTQDKVLVQNYEFDTWTTNNMRLTVFGQTDLGLELAWNQIDETAGDDSWERWDTTEEIWREIGVTQGSQKTLAGDDLGFIYDLNSDYDDYFTSISAITNASQAVLTVGAAGFLPGDEVIVSNVEGMTEINNYDPEEDPTDYEPYVVVSATTTSVTLNVDSTDFTAYSAGGSLSKVISFYAETIPFNPYRSLGRRCYVSHVEFLIDNTGGYLQVSVKQDEEESPFKGPVLLKPSSTSTKAREWITLTVDNEANFMTLILEQQSPAVQVRVTSIRIHCAPGGLTSG